MTTFRDYVLLPLIEDALADLAAEGWVKFMYIEIFTPNSTVFE